MTNVFGIQSKIMLAGKFYTFILYTDNKVVRESFCIETALVCPFTSSPITMYVNKS